MLASGISLLAGQLATRGPVFAAQPLKTATPVSKDAAEAARLTRFTRSQRQMGVEFRISVYAAEEEAANSAMDAAFARIARLNGILSDYDPTSELRRLCDASPPGTPVPVSDELWHVLAAAQRLAKATRGRFDVTVGPLVRLWRRARRQKELPSARLLAEARKAVGHQLLRLHEDGQRVELLRAGMRLDLGGIAKGYAADEAVRVLRERGLPRSLVDGSGDIVAGDPPPGTTGWTIAIAPLRLPASAARPPAEGETGTPAEPAAAILLRHGAVATSGDAYQHVEIGGVRYSHIVDPATGLGLTTPSSVTVLAPTGMQADALASAVSVLGPEEGIRLINLRKQTAALVALIEEGRIQTHTSCRWKMQTGILRYPFSPDADD